jgi:hypothetical protein
MAIVASRLSSCSSNSGSSCALTGATHQFSLAKARHLIASFSVMSTGKSCGNRKSSGLKG